jgi:hypothetical protein
MTLPNWKRGQTLKHGGPLAEIPAGKGLSGKEQTIGRRRISLTKEEEFCTEVE